MIESADFIKYLEGLGVTVGGAGKLMGLGNATLDKALKKKHLSIKLVEKILSQFPDFKPKNSNNDPMKDALIEQMRKNIELLERENKDLRNRLNLSDITNPKQHKKNFG